MNEFLRECEIIGYGKYTDKETKEEKIRVIIAIESSNENYFGKQVAPAFLDYSDSLATKLITYLTEKDKFKAYYKTTDNIVTGKTKVSEIIIK